MRRSARIPRLHKGRGQVANCDSRSFAGEKFNILFLDLVKYDILSSPLPSLLERSNSGFLGEWHWARFGSPCLCPSCSGFIFRSPDKLIQAFSLLANSSPSFYFYFEPGFCGWTASRGLGLDPFASSVPFYRPTICLFEHTGLMV